MNVHSIPLTDVLIRFADATEDDFIPDGSNRYKTVCPFHNDRDPSLVLFDNTDKGEGWSYKCFVCKGVQGRAPKLLVQLGKAENEDQARDMLEEAFGIRLPDTVQLEHFARYKGLDPEFLKQNGLKDLKAGLLFPFFDEDHNVIAKKVRTKYKGKDKYYYIKEDGLVTTVPYGLHWVGAYDTSYLYITEGETDALTLRQCGLQSLGIVSTNAWDQRCEAVVNKFRRIIVVKDQDAAGDQLLKDVAASFPSNTYVKLLPKNVKDPNDLFNFRCGSNQDKFLSFFKRLPAVPATVECFLEEARRDRKITHVEEAWRQIAPLFKNQLEVADFLEELRDITGYGKTELKAMLDKAKAETMVMEGESLGDDFFELNNCYYKTIYTSGVPTKRQVSNFVLRPKYRKLTEDGEIRIVTIVNKYGEQQTVELTPEDLSTATNFDTRVKAVGRNIFYGDNTDLKVICDIIFDGANKLVYSPLAVGHITKDHWVFGNCGIDRQGTVHPISDEGIINLNDTLYMPRSIASNIDEGDVDNYMPYFDYTAEPLTDDDLKDLLHSFKQNLGSYNAWLGLGWCVANWYSDAVFNKYKFFPFFFIVGKRGQGKTTFASLLNRVFGYNHDYSGRSFDNSTPASMSRALAYPCSLPIWYDDYKDNQSPQRDPKTQLLLGAYNRQGGDRANRYGTGIETRNVKATIMLSGEFAPSNSALKTRCVTVVINGNHRDNSLYNKVSRYFSRLNRNALDWAAEAQSPKEVERYLELMEHYTEQLEQCGVMDRAARNMAVFLAGFHKKFGHLISKEELDDFIRFAKNLALSDKGISDEIHHITKFFLDLGQMLSSPSSELRYGKHIMLHNNEVRIKRSDVYNLWKAFQPEKKLPVNEATLKSDLENEPFYIADAPVRCRFEDGNFRIWSFDYKKMMDNPLLHDFLEMLDRLKEKYEEY